MPDFKVTMKQWEKAMKEIFDLKAEVKALRKEKAEVEKKVEEKADDAPTPPPKKKSFLEEMFG
jgi:hypothetical protein